MSTCIHSKKYNKGKLQPVEKFHNTEKNAKLKIMNMQKKSVRRKNVKIWEIIH